MPWHESIIESELAKTKVLVNATSIGLTDDVTPIPAEIIPPELLVLDLIYKRTRLLRDAEAAGCTVSDGELMLLHQGAAAFTLWTGQPAPLELMQQAAPGGSGGRRPLGRGRAGRRRGRTADAGATNGTARPTAPTRAGNPPATPRQASRPGPPRRTDGRHPVGRLRFLTAGESHGRRWASRSRACPPGLPLSADAARDRPRPAPARLRPRRAPGDRARPGRDRRRRPPRPDARLADPAPRREPRLGELDAGHAGRGAVRRRGRGARGARRRAATSGRRRSPASGPATPTSPGR